MDKLLEIIGTLLLLYVVYHYVLHPEHPPQEMPPQIERNFTFPLDDGRAVRVRVTADPTDLVNVPPQTAPCAEWFRRLHRTGHRQMRPLYETIAREVRHERYELDRAVLRMVQEMPYREIPDRYREQPTSNVWYPAVALQEGYGDCDTKVLLAASLLTHHHPVLVLHGMHHAIVAVPGIPAPGDHYVRAVGRTWLLCELTHPGRIGRVSEEVWWDVRTGKYEHFLVPGKKF